MNFEHAKKIFYEYLNQYDTENGSIKLKVIHTFEVVKKSEYIAKGLNLNTEDIELAKIIALLHDIGRFEQIKKYGFFDNKKLEHAKFGIIVLFENGLIRKFIHEEKYDNIIKKAIYNHNKYAIEEGLDDRELLHCRIIRDADKLDNFRILENEKFEDRFPNIYNKETINTETISLKVYNDFMNEKCIELTDRKTIIDYWVCSLAFIFDLNFDISLKYVKDRNYIDILIDRINYENIETKERMEEIRKCAKNYIHKNITK
ncbi:MAG: HD domain-containing protein [Clostridia bacterium]|nr:HD domain-containing protein [Clostridia bacterium]